MFLFQELYQELYNFCIVLTPFTFTYIFLLCFMYFKYSLAFYWHAHENLSLKQISDSLNVFLLHFYYVALYPSLFPIFEYCSIFKKRSFLFEQGLILLFQKEKFIYLREFVQFQNKFSYFNFTILFFIFIFISFFVL